MSQAFSLLLTGGHYTAYCLNYLNDQWYEFDDQYVTEVDVGQVINCEAYVLFYRYILFISHYVTLSSMFRMCLCFYTYNSPI